MAFLQIINADLVWSFFAFLLLFQIFFYVTIEEYYFGSLDFPMVNAVNEGTTGTFLILLVGVFLGNGVYAQEALYGFKYYELIFGVIILGVTIQNLVTIIKLFINFKVLDVIWKNFLFTFATLSYVLIFFLSNHDVLLNQTKVIYYIYTVIFSRIILSIMIAHLFDANFDQLQVFPLVASSLMILLVCIEKFLVDRTPLFIILILKLPTSCT